MKKTRSRSIDLVRPRNLLVGALSAVLMVALTTPVTAQSGERVYVCNQDGASISVIDIGTLEVIETIDLTKFGFSANAKPHHVAVEADGSAWYVTLIGENVILKFDRNNQIIGRATFETPGLLALHRSRDLLYVGRSMTAVNPPHRLGVIDRSEMSIEEIDIVFPRPHLLDLRPSGDFVYTASLAVNQVASVEVESEDVEIITLEGPSHSLAHSAMSPDGGTLVVTPHMPHVMVFDLSDPASPVLSASIDVGEMPWHPIFTPNGRFVYVPNQGSNNVSVVDMQTRSVVKTIEHEAFAQPYGTAISPDGRHVFVSNNNTRGAWTPDGANAGAAPVGNVVVIDTSTREVVKVLPVGRGPTGMGARREW